MEQPQNPSADVKELAQELMRQVRENLERQELDQAIASLNLLYPVDQAELLSELDREQRQVLLNALSPEASAKILEQMAPQDAVEVFGEIEAPDLSGILDNTRPDVAADLLKQLPEERSQQTLEGMQEVEGVTPLLEYPDESAGGQMTPTFVSVRDDMTAANALDSIRILGPEGEDINSIIVVDEERRIVGSLKVVKLALARPTSLVQDLMNPEVVFVTSGTDQEECALLMERYDLNQLPVVDEESRLIGVIRGEDLVDVLEEEATEDMLGMTGIAGERLFGPLQESVRRRLPWLYLNLATTLLAALVISAFESTIARVVTLVVFLPVVAGQGGIGGTQILTLVTRSIALGDIPARRVIRLLSRELALGLIHGVLLGVIIGLIANWWKGNWTLGLVLGLAMVGNMIVAGLAGAGTPLALRLFRLDPALGSAVVVTTVTDVVGFLLFLGIAAALVEHLV